MNLPEEILEQLKGIYGDFNEELMKLDDWEIRVPTQKQNNPKLYQTLSNFKSSLIK